MEENTNKKNKLKKLKGALSSAAMIMMLNSCDVPETNVNTVDSTSTTTVESTSEITTEELTTETPTTEVTTEEPTTEYQIETIEYECPIEYNEEMITDFSEYLGNITYTDRLYDLGYDNPMLRQKLIDYVEEKTGTRDESITIDNFKYFQFAGKGSLLYDHGISSNSIADQAEKDEPAPDLYIIRAALIENDLRYLIDEIPYSYFEERFPDIVDNYSSPEYREQLYERGGELYDIYQLENTLVDLPSIPEEDRDLIEFLCLKGYNLARTTYIYRYNIPQVRDINTNKIQLNPVKSQLDQINKGVSKIPGFIDDVSKVETKENYYECYGKYPEDVISVDESMTKSK